MISEHEFSRDRRVYLPRRAYGEQAGHRTGPSMEIRVDRKAIESLDVDAVKPASRMSTRSRED